MNTTTMVYGVNPDELTEKILKGVKSELEQFKKEIETSEQKEFLSREKTAKMLSISMFCLHDWVKKGILLPMKMGNRTYFERKQIEKKLFESNKKNNE